jgi:hypothetical protein
VPWPPHSQQNLTSLVSSSASCVIGGRRTYRHWCSSPAVARRDGRRPRGGRTRRTEPAQRRPRGAAHPSCGRRARPSDLRDCRGRHPAEDLRSPGEQRRLARKRIERLFQPCTARWHAEDVAWAGALSALLEVQARRRPTSRRWRSRWQVSTTTSPIALRPARLSAPLPGEQDLQEAAAQVGQLGKETGKRGRTRVAQLPNSVVRSRKDSA